MKGDDIRKSECNDKMTISANNALEDRILSNIKKREEEIEALKKLLDNLLKTTVKSKSHSQSKK